jgi:hypothetical protein
MELVFKPSYIEPRQFAVALIQSVQNASGNFEDLEKDIDKIENQQIRQLLKGMYGRAAGQVDLMHAELVAWFNNGMDRVSGAYKRRSQLTCFLIALALAVMLNVDAIHVFSTLWKHSSLVAALPAGASAAADMTKVLNELNTLPVGWQPGASPQLDFRQIPGWLITASSALFGAPFWFGALQKLVNLRGAGSKTATQETKI